MIRKYAMRPPDLFRRHSWDVSVLVDLNHQEIMDVLIASVRQQPPDAFIMLSGHGANLPNRLAGTA
jgi:hypothetical protein